MWVGRYIYHILQKEKALVSSMIATIALSLGTLVNSEFYTSSEG